MIAKHPTGGDNEPSGASGDDTNDEAPDRATRVGFFSTEEGMLDDQSKSPIFCMRKKDVRTVQRRFISFYHNWKDFLLKDLIVKRVAVGDTETTFQPMINEQSKALVPQGRQKVWERELPKR